MIQQSNKPDNKSFETKIILHLNYDLVKYSRAPTIINILILTIFNYSLLLFILINISCKLSYFGYLFIKYIVTFLKSNNLS